MTNTSSAWPCLLLWIGLTLTGIACKPGAPTGGPSAGTTPPTGGPNGGTPAGAPSPEAATYTPRAGDLLFLVAPDTAGPTEPADAAFSNAITAATAQGATLKFSHVAIVALKDDGTPYVVEASSRCGVARTAWDDFLAAAEPINGQPGVVVMRVTDPHFPLNEAVVRAESHIGQAYDWSFLPDNGQFYCSELVYESFRKTDGTPLFTARPMNFRDADGRMPAFWTELFERLGEPIPEGVPGTNPHDLAQAPVLKEVWRFF